ncbi:MAG: DUF4349 domain-containing protein [Dehalococcoidia bacterium]|nr:DUF4349 domain-containing protein [Dehalococcoidia bacterium]
MKHKLLFWIPLVVLGLLALSCAASAPLKAPAAAPAQEGVPLLSGPSAPSDAGRSAAAAPKGAGGPAEPGGGSPGAVTALDRKIIYSAQASMEVKDANKSLEDIAVIAESHGGFVANSSFRYEGERKVATVTIRVPALAYQATLAELRRLAIKVENEDAKSQDVTEEYTDLDAQLVNLQATEAQYLELLKRAQSIDEILRVQARISETRGQIERLKGRMKYLDRNTDMASISVTLFSRDKGTAGPKEEPIGWWKTPQEAWEQSLLFLGRIASAFAIGVAFFWWAIILIASAIALVVWRAKRPARKVQQ